MASSDSVPFFHFHAHTVPGEETNDGSKLVLLHKLQPGSKVKWVRKEIKINENAKTPAFYNFFPELNHNEMVGYTLPQGKFHIITLLDKEDHPQNIKRMRATAKLLKNKGIDTTIIEMQDSNIFNTIFTTLLLGDWTSYYLALEYKQDPTPVDMVEELKKQLA